MKFLYKLNNGIGKVEQQILSWSIIVMAVVLITNAVGRTVFNYSFKSVVDICQFLILLLTFIGLSNAARRGTHVVMSAILDTVPKKIRKIMCVIVAAGTFAFLIFLTVISYQYVVEVFGNGRITAALGIPTWIFMALIPLGFGLGAFQYFLTLVSNITNKGKAYIAPEKEYVSEVENAEAVKNLEKQMSLQDEVTTEPEK